MLRQPGITGSPVYQKLGPPLKPRQASVSPMGWGPLQLQPQNRTDRNEGKASPAALTPLSAQVGPLAQPERLIMLAPG